MTDPIAFAASTPRHDLPTLFAGQAQKEFTLNEALARIDALLQPVVEGEANAPSASPSEGESWIVGSAPTGSWGGHAGSLASYTAGNWLFAAPVRGMRVFDKAAGRYAIWDNGWTRAAAVAAPTGGTTADTQARAAIAGLIAALKLAKVLPPA